MRATLKYSSSPHGEVRALCEPRTTRAWHYPQKAKPRLRRGFSTFGRRSAQQRNRVDRCCALAQFEVQLWLGDRTGLAGGADHVATVDVSTLGNTHRTKVSIGRHITVGMTDEDEVAITFNARADIDDSAVVGRLDRGTIGHFDIDAGTLGRGEVHQHATAYRPAEAGACSRSWRCGSGLRRRSGVGDLNRRRGRLS